MSWNVRSRRSSSEYPVSAQSAGFTRTKWPVGSTSAMPNGDCSKTASSNPRSADAGATGAMVLRSAVMPRGRTLGPRRPTGNYHSRMRLGVTPPVEVAGFPAAVDICVRAEELGYTDVWTAEVGAVDAFSPLAAVAVRTSAVRLGVGLVPVFTRPPALVAMSAAGIQNLSGGRFVLGIGASSPVIVGQWMGVPFERPVDRVEEYVALLRDMLAGRKVAHDGGTVSSHGFRLQIGVDAPVPIHVGALGPRMCRLAGRVADGVLFFLMTPDG